MQPRRTDYVFNFFPQHKVVGLLNFRPRPETSSLLDFLFSDPLRALEVVVVLLLLYPSLCCSDPFVVLTPPHVNGLTDVVHFSYIFSYFLILSLAYFPFFHFSLNIFEGLLFFWP